MLDLISDYIGSLIMVVGSVLFTRFVLKNKIKGNSLIVILLMLIFPLLISLSLYFDNLSFRTLISFILFIILFKYSFKTSVFQALLFSIMYVILMVISEMLVFLILSEVIVVDSDYLYNVFAGSILSNLVISAIDILIGFINRFWLIKLANIKIKNYLTFYLILLFACIIFFFYVTFSNIGNGIGVFSGITAIVILLVVAINLLIQAHRNNELTIKYDKLLDFIKKYEVEIDNQRTMRHEIKNQLLTIKSKIIDNDKNNNIINYIDEILQDNSMEINHAVYAKLGSLPANGLKGLFYFKVSEAHDKEIDVKINISKNIEKSVLGNLNSVMFNQIGKVLGILLDNAIEASELVDKKMIGIEIYVVDERVSFIISNTYIGKINSGVGMFSRSTKGGNRGHGLLLARAIVNSNNRLSLDTEITDDLYIQKFSVK